MNTAKIKTLENKIVKLNKDIEKTTNEIDRLTETDRVKEFKRLKKEVEDYNDGYSGHFIEELKKAWEKEDIEKNDMD